MNEYEAMEFEAMQDLKAAQILLEKGLFARSLQHSLEASEKMVKAILIKKGHGTIISHATSDVFVSQILGKSDEKWMDELKNVCDCLLVLEENVGRVRYPRKIRGKVIVPSKEYTRIDAQKNYEMAEKVIKILGGYLKYLKVV